MAKTREKARRREVMDRILVIKLGALGDFILSYRAMTAIRAHHRARARLPVGHRFSTQPATDVQYNFSLQVTGWFQIVA